MANNIKHINLNSSETQSDGVKIISLSDTGAGGGSDVFWATYGTTTYATILAAYSGGKLCACAYNNNNYILARIDAGSANFMALNGATGYRITCGSDNSWYANSYGNEQTANKKSSWSSTPNDTNYPSEKLVYDSLGKRGVISQVKTWSGTGSQPRTYTIDPASIVRGIIPQANIDLFESAGATFNSTTGYFELNGLTDISYEEMRAIYDTTIGLVPCRDRTTGMLGTTSPRATLPMRGTTSFASAIAYFAYDMQNLEQITFNQFVYNTAANQTIMAFRNCFCLKAIYGYLRLYSTTNDADIFTNCYSLESVNINYLRGSIALKQSSLLSLDSVVYMVENAANTSAITITLHATAYARCQADTTEYTYQGNTYTGILALATAHNISIASA